LVLVPSATTYAYFIISVSEEIGKPIYRLTNFVDAKRLAEGKQPFGEVLFSVKDFDAFVSLVETSLPSECKLKLCFASDSNHAIRTWHLSPYSTEDVANSIVEGISILQARKCSMTPPH
jgi:hypothetical protein